MTAANKICRASIYSPRRNIRIVSLFTTCFTRSGIEFSSFGTRQEPVTWVFQSWATLPATFPYWSRPPEVGSKQISHNASLNSSLSPDKWISVSPIFPNGSIATGPRFYCSHTLPPPLSSTHNVLVDRNRLLPLIISFSRFAKIPSGFTEFFNVSHKLFAFARLKGNAIETKIKVSFARRMNISPAPSRYVLRLFRLCEMRLCPCTGASKQNNETAFGTNWYGFVFRAR